MAEAQRFDSQSLKVKNMNRHGLCCIHVGLQNKGFRFQTMTVKRFKELGRDKALPILADRYKNNLNVIYRIMQECARKNWCYRIGSDIFPLMTHSESNIKWEDLPNFRELDALFASCSKFIHCNNLRTSCHPDQFNVLASENIKAVDQTIIELNHHGWFMDKLTTESYNDPINIHINGSKGDPKDIAKRFRDNLNHLSATTKKRLVVENEDKGIWHVQNLLEHIHSLTSIPITFDYLHHKCNPGNLTEEEAFRLCVNTWNKNRPLFHFAETLPGQNNLRKHADLPTYIPDTYSFCVDLDFEFKQKDFALEIAEKLLLAS